MQVVNTLCPNAVQNTVLLAIFKAGDSITNLDVAMSQYKLQVEELQGMQWRYYELILTIHDYISYMKRVEAESLHFWGLRVPLLGLRPIRSIW